MFEPYIIEFVCDFFLRLHVYFLIFFCIFLNLEWTKSLYAFVPISSIPIEWFYLSHKQLKESLLYTQIQFITLNNNHRNSPVARGSPYLDSGLAKRSPFLDSNVAKTPAYLDTGAGDQPVPGVPVFRAKRLLNFGPKQRD